ncbi:MAG: hypothetical protein P8Y52_09325, partial [Xanthomonadales bacterium]
MYGKVSPSMSVAELEVDHLQVGLVLAVDVDQRLFDIGPRGVARDTGGEGVVGRGRRVVQCGRHQVVGDPVVRDVGALGLRPHQRRIPVPVTPGSAETLQEAPGLGRVVDDARVFDPAVVGHEQGMTFTRHIVFGQERQPVRRTTRTERVVVVLRAHD